MTTATTTDPAAQARRTSNRLTWTDRAQLAAGVTSLVALAATVVMAPRAYH
jgi:hypothetical protein